MKIQFLTKIGDTDCIKKTDIATVMSPTDKPLF